MAEKESELLRNGSGYVDMTAYKALKKVEKSMNGGIEKMEKVFIPGEIWESKTNNAESAYYLIVAVQDNVCNVLKLKSEEEKSHGNIEVIAKEKMYTDAGLISYVSKWRLCRFVRVLTGVEFEKVKTCILEKLGFDEFLSFDSRTDVDAEKQIRSLHEQIDRIKEENEKIKANHKLEMEAYYGNTCDNNIKIAYESVIDMENKLETLQNERDCLMHEVDRLNTELRLKANGSEGNVKLQVERDFYKEQYEKLFGMVTKNALTV